VQWEIAYEWRVFHGKIIGKLVGGLEHVLFLIFSLPIKNGDIPYIYNYIYIYTAWWFGNIWIMFPFSWEE